MTDFEHEILTAMARYLPFWERDSSSVWDTLVIEHVEGMNYRIVSRCGILETVTEFSLKLAMKEVAEKAISQMMAIHVKTTQEKSQEPLILVAAIQRTL